MRIGITYDLKDDYIKEGFSAEEAAEFDSMVTIDAIDGSLRMLGFETDRIGSIKSLVRRLACGGSWDLVFNIAEGLYGDSRESQVPALLDAYRIPYTFSGPLVLGLALDKGTTKHLLRNNNIPTADFYVIKEEKDIFNVRLPYPLFAKPVAEGTSKGISTESLIENDVDLLITCRDLLSRFCQPVLLETYLPGREFTVGVIGTGDKARVIGALEVELTKNASGSSYSYENKANYQDRVTYRLAEDQTAIGAMETALSAWRHLGCLDCGRVDLRCDNRSIPNFIEVNPLAGLNPEVSDLPILCRLKGIPYEELIRMIVNSTLERCFGEPATTGIPALI